MIFVCEILRFVRVLLMYNINLIELFSKVVEFRLRCFSLVIVFKKLKFWIEVLEMFKWVIEFLLVKEKILVLVLNVVLDKMSFFKEVNMELWVFDMEIMVYLFMSKYLRCGMFGVCVMLVYERLRKYKFGNLRILIVFWLVILFF